MTHSGPISQLPLTAIPGNLWPLDTSYVWYADNQPGERSANSHRIKRTHKRKLIVDYEREQIGLEVLPSLGYTT